MKINKQSPEQIKRKQGIKKKFFLCSVLATFKEEKDNVNLVELANTTNIHLFKGNNSNTRKR